MGNLIAAGALLRGPVRTGQDGSLAVLRDPHGAMVGCPQTARNRVKRCPGTSSTYSMPKKRWRCIASSLAGSRKKSSICPWESVLTGCLHRRLERLRVARLRAAHRPQVHTHWLFYFAVDDLDAACARVVAQGGRSVFRPGGSVWGRRIAVCHDPKAQSLRCKRPPQSLLTGGSVRGSLLAMSVRRSVAPDIAGCTFVLFAVTLSFAVLRAPFIHKQAGAMAQDLLSYGGLMFGCMLTAAVCFAASCGLFPAVLLSVVAIYAAAINWHMPETGQLPAGVLGLTTCVLLLLRYREFGGSPARILTSERGVGPLLTFFVCCSRRKCTQNTHFSSLHICRQRNTAEPHPWMNRSCYVQSQGLRDRLVGDSDVRSSRQSRSVSVVRHSRPILSCGPRLSRVKSSPQF